MPSGLTIYNTSNTVQIDENWRNYGFKYKFSQSFTTSDDLGGPPPVIDYGFTANGTNALLCAVKSPVQEPFRLHSYFDGSTWSFNWKFLHDSGDVYVPGSHTGTVDFYIFDVLDGGGFSNVGLEVFNASAQRVYHSDMQVMRCETIQLCSSSYTGPGGRSFAPLILRTPAGGQAVGGVGFRAAQYCVRSNGTNITSRIRSLSGHGTLITSVDPGLFAAIDVTGF